MRQAISSFAAGLLIPAGLMLASPAAIAHQSTSLGGVKATVHLEPDDSPYAGQPSLTWFHFVRPDGETVSLSDCNCRLVVYDSQNQPIAQPQLGEAPVEEHGQGHGQGHIQPITTSIVFPTPGTYQLVFTAESRAKAFEPFEMTVPVTVRP